MPRTLDALRRSLRLSRSAAPANAPIARARGEAMMKATREVLMAGAHVPGRLGAAPPSPRRWMYRGGRPNAVARLLDRATVAAVAAGLSPKRLVALEVTGRRTGRRLSLPVVVADLHGRRYLVAMLGERSEWAQNVRAAGGRAIIRHGRRAAVRLEEVPAEHRAAILKRYLELAPGARAHVSVDRHAPLAEFERVAARYPVFLIADPQPGDPLPAGDRR